MKPAVILLLLSCFSLSAHAALNKWVDENGKVHYSDTPPANATVETVRNITGKDQKDAATNYSPKNYAEREAELRKARQGKADAAAKAAEETARGEERQRNCLAARENLRALEEGTRLVVYDENGVRRYLDDAERAQRLNSAQAAVKANCD